MALEHKADREVVLEAVRQNGDVPRHVAPEHRADREFMLEAVKQNGYALRHAAPKPDREIVLEAVK